MTFSNPAVADFKSQFFRDFPFGTDIASAVVDADITSAFTYVNASGGPNQDFFPDQASYTYGYLLLAAHEMVLSLRASSQGINGQYNWLQVSKGVGGVSEAFSIPQEILDNPQFSMLSKTNYGVRFLAIIYPQMRGGMYSVSGTTIA